MYTIQMPYVDRRGRLGTYNGQVDVSFTLHGISTLEYDNGVVKEGGWRNGSYRRSHAGAKGEGGAMRRRDARGGPERSQSGSLIMVPVEGGGGGRKN